MDDSFPVDTTQKTKLSIGKEPFIKDMIDKYEQNSTVKGKCKLGSLELFIYKK